TSFTKSVPSPDQNLSRRACGLDRTTTARRHHRVDLTQRAHLHPHTPRGGPHPAWAPTPPPPPGHGCSPNSPCPPARWCSRTAHHPLRIANSRCPPETHTTHTTA